MTTQHLKLATFMLLVSNSLSGFRSPFFVRVLQVLHNILASHHAMVQWHQQRLNLASFLFAYFINLSNPGPRLYRCCKSYSTSWPACHTMVQWHQQRMNLATFLIAYFIKYLNPGPRLCRCGKSLPHPGQPPRHCAVAPALHEC